MTLDVQAASHLSPEFRRRDHETAKLHNRLAAVRLAAQGRVPNVLLIMT